MLGPMKRWLLLSFALVGCVHSTPVTPAPLSPEDAPKLQAAIVGACKVTATQKEGAEKKDDASGLSFWFDANGNAGYAAANPFGGVVKISYKYKLDGRNILMDGPYKTFRADDYSTNELKLFVYDLSQTYYCTKV